VVAAYAHQLVIDIFVPGAGNNAGEIFNYNPEVCMQPGQVTAGSSYNAATSLPPVL
jgi:hypothetical protein